MSRLHYKNYSNVKSASRILRKNQTDSEKKLWDILKDKKISGYKFLRQHPLFQRIDSKFIKFYIADFYCARLRLIIELDGPIHEFSLENDRERDELLTERGYCVKRFKNEDLKDINQFIANLTNFIKQIEG